MTLEKNLAARTIGSVPDGIVRRQRTSAFCSLCLVALLAGLPWAALAQSSSPPDSQEGISSGGYTIHNSTEIGFRFSDRTGNPGMYDTLVDLHQGPRLLEQTLSLQSQTHEGVFFDNLFISSFGWGGEPENAMRLRADKDKWYNFQASFRRDQNFFDYNLLANPLNPPLSRPSVPIEDSPHEFASTRRMSDIDLTLLPQSKISVRLGYSRNNMTGPTFSSFHEGTDVLLSQPWNTTLNSYRFGVDWKLAPRTVVSYDQFLDYYKGDTDQFLYPTYPALLPGGTPVYLGLPFDTASRFPCGIPQGQTTLISPTGVLNNLACNGYFSYSRLQRMRTSIPTERVSLRSNYWSRLDLTASYAYSDADMTTPLTEAFNGLVTRTNTRSFTTTGIGSAHRISDVVDLQATVYLFKHLRVVNKFYFWAYRIPENGNFTEVDNNCTANCDLLTPLSGTAPATTATLTQSSFDQNWKRNQTELVWDISSKVGTRIGYRYGNRRFDHFIDFAGDDDHFTVHEHTALFGAWARPLPRLRLNFDLEHTSYDDVIVRIAPRKESRYRFQANYSPRPWATIGGSINLLEDSNGESSTAFDGHNRNYGFNASITPKERFGFDVAYNYNQFLQNALICFNDTPPQGVVLPVVTNAGDCSVNDPNNPLLTGSQYVNNNHFGMFTFRVKPVKRVTARLGYSITSVDGDTTQFNALQPLGPLNYKYQQPVVDLGVELGHNLTWNTGWNYYQYSEGSFVGPTANRYFHTNNATLSLRYAF